MSAIRFLFAGLLASSTAAIAFGLCPCSFAGDDAAPAKAPASAPKAAAEKPAPVEIDKKLPALTMTDTEGKTLDLHNCGIKKEEAEAAVMAAVKKLGVKTPTASTKVADLPGMKDDDGDLDAEAVKTLANDVGSYFGLIATSDTVARFKTLGDFTKWIAKADGSPILLITWSPNCGSFKKANDLIIDMASKTDVRIFALACNTRDSDKNYADYRENYEFPVRAFPDREQKVTDIVGGKTTPHFFLLDKDAVLRYRGALNNDPMGFMDEEDLENYVEDAVAALRAGKPVVTKTTEPSG